MAFARVHVDDTTHAHLERLASDLGATVDETVALAVRAFRQDRAGRQLATPLRGDETAWLEGGVG